MARLTGGLARLIPMGPLVIVKAGRKPAGVAEVPGDYEHWLLDGMGIAREKARVIDLAGGEPLPPVDTVTAVIVTGSGAMVTDRWPWVLAAEEWLRAAIAREVAILGVCFGHQLLAQALGGRVEYNRKGAEVGTVALTLTEEAATDPLFARLPSPLLAQASHRQAVVALPAGARVLAGNPMDPHQAIAYGARAWGVQFHPEFSDEVMRRFIADFAPLLREEGKDPEAIRAAVRATPESRGILRRFAALAGLRRD